MNQQNLILTEREASAVVQAIRSADTQEIERLELHVRSGARIVFFTGGGSIAMYSTRNSSQARGPGVLSSDENYVSVDMLASAYGIALVA